MLASCNHSKWHPALRYYCPNVSQLVCNQRKHATRCSLSDWLVSVDGVNECISNMVRNSGKRILSLFAGIFAGVNECSFSKFVSFVVGFGHFSGPRLQRIMAFPKFVSFWVGFLAILWPKVMKNHVVPKIRVFLHPEMLKFHGVGELSCWGHKLEI